MLTHHYTSFHCLFTHWAVLEPMSQCALFKSLPNQVPCLICPQANTVAERSHSYTHLCASRFHDTSSSGLNHRAISSLAVSGPSLPWMMFLRGQARGSTVRVAKHVISVPA